MQVSVTPGINPYKADVVITFTAKNQYAGVVEVPVPEMLKQLTLVEIKQDVRGLDNITATFSILVSSNGPPLQYVIPALLRKSLVERPG